MAKKPCSSLCIKTTFQIKLPWLIRPIWSQSLRMGVLSLLQKSPWWLQWWVQEQDLDHPKNYKTLFSSGGHSWKVTQIFCLCWHFWVWFGYISEDYNDALGLLCAQSKLYQYPVYICHSPLDKIVQKSLNEKEIIKRKILQVTFLIDFHAQTNSACFSASLKLKNKKLFYSEILSWFMA